MNTINGFIESGILEAYVTGVATTEEIKQVEQMASAHPEVKEEIEQIRTSIEQYITENSKTPHPALMPLIMATIDYMERLKGGEPMTFPPELNENSKIDDFSQWLHRKDMVKPENFDEFYAKIIGHTPEATTAIAWIKTMAPHETHHDEYEKFLVIEGSCDIIIGETVHQLVPGDYLAIPLHLEHVVKVTSLVPCKIILQRIAA